MKDLKNYGFATKPFNFSGASNRDYTPLAEWIYVNRNECPEHIRTFDVSPATNVGQCLFAKKVIGNIEIYAANTYDGGCVCFISKNNEVAIASFADAPSGYSMLTPCSESITEGDLMKIYGLPVNFCKPREVFTNASYTTYFK